jgi:hypothetical protein
VLDRWVGERFLFLLGQSKRREQFVLKGATLFLIWKGRLPRPTHDVDLLRYGSPQVEDVVAIIKEILWNFGRCAVCSVNVSNRHFPANTTLWVIETRGGILAGSLPKTMQSEQR